MNKEEIIENIEKESKVFTVKFDTDGGSNIDDRLVKENTILGNIVIPKKDGYKFVEWQVDGKKYDENTLVTSDIILKAKWEKVSKEEPIKEPNKEDTNVSEEVITKTINIKNPKIKAINLYSDGKIKVVEPYFYGNDSVINVKVEGKKSLVDKIDASNISLGVDMSKYKKETSIVEDSIIVTNKVDGVKYEVLNPKVNMNVSTTKIISSTIDKINLNDNILVVEWYAVNSLCGSSYIASNYKDVFKDYLTGNTLAIVSDDYEYDTDKEIKEKKSEVKEQEDRLLQRENNIDRRDTALQNRETALEERENNLLDKQQKIQEAKEEMEEIKRKELEELERISKYTKEQARDAVMKMVETKMSKEIAAYIKEMESEAKLEVDERAKELLVGTMQKYAADITSEQTVSVIALPNDEMKGRLIGREGRNIRTIESVTGVDLIIDDTPEAIVISSFDPLRREIARLTLETLIKDGRIHPARIEELYAKTCADVKQTIKEFGKNALYELGLSKMDPELVEIVGKLHFRSSYGQNALTHSMEVANLAGIMASELGENVNLAKRAGLLHDIGKAIDFEMEGSHVKIGVDLAKKYGEDEVVINAIASHHGEVPPTSIISSIVAIADAVSASRPGARNDSSENYVQRLEQLEEIGNKMQGVEKAYAIQAGRELRVMVKPDEVDDLTAHQIAREIKEKIENELKYPGTIKVTVIRETRAQEEAK